MSTFSIKTVLNRVTHGKAEVDTMLASYGDATRQAAQRKVWETAGWVYDPMLLEWYFNHPVPQIVVDGDETKSFPTTMTQAEANQFGDVANDYYDVCCEQFGVIKTTNCLRAGLQYRTRPNLKAAPKNADVSDIRLAYNTAAMAAMATPATLPTAIRMMTELTAAQKAGTEKDFLRAWSATQVV